MRAASPLLLLSVLLLLPAGCVRLLQVDEGDLVLRLHPVSSERVSRSEFELVFQATLENGASTSRGVIATLASSSPAVTVVQGSVGFDRVAPGGSSTQGEVIVRYDRSQGFDASALTWSFEVVDAGPDRTVSSCEEVALSGGVAGGASALRWDAEGVPLVLVEQLGAGEASFRAPAVAAPTELALVLQASGAGGLVVSDAMRVTVEPGPVEPGLAVGMAPGCAPFRHGVASGDPTADGVLLWTRLTPEPGADLVVVDWEMALDPGFEVVVAAGGADTDPSRDFTVQVEVTGLSPATTYYYRFLAPDGRSSPPGRTRTAPLGAVDRLRFAVASCSSVYSGFFNAYRRIAERTELDLVIHLGDYLYDFVDLDEQVRVPEPFPTRPDDLAEWRARHAYYLSDPDLRWARAMHPWFLIWDNHDVAADATPDYEGSVRAFREWNPMREPEPGFPEIAYRSLAYGDLADLVIMDALLFRNQDTVPGTGMPSILGNAQYAWLSEALMRSDAAWRVLGSQKLFSTLRVDPDLIAAIDGEPREVFDPKTWDGFPEARSRLLALLANLGLDDNVVVSGDAHISLAFDLVDDPTNEEMPYDPATSDAALGVEFMPPSISRGNFDETLLGLGRPPRTIPPFLAAVLADTLPRNPHGLYGELTSHGYGVLDLTPERAVAEYWYSDILDRSDEETLGASFTVLRGANRWSRE
jgi:alkaline phosphatase D